MTCTHRKPIPLEILKYSGKASLQNTFSLHFLISTFHLTLFLKKNVDIFGPFKTLPRAVSAGGTHLGKKKKTLPMYILPNST